MVPLYFVSNEAYSGKSSTCIALGKILVERGLKVGYMKPAGTLPVRINGITTDEDARYIKVILETNDDLEDITPIVLTQNYYREGLRDEDFSSSFLDLIEKSYQKIKQGKNIVLLEGAGNIESGMFLGISSKDICSRLKAKAILILRYSTEIADKVLIAKEFLGDNFGGIIINWIPQNQADYLTEIILPFFLKKEIKVFGSIYIDKTLSSVTIKEVADLLEGKIICAKDKVDELISSFMIGAMSEEQALIFFKKQSNKAVITGGDRADVQLAALETDTKCLILTGNFQPPSVVTNRAEELGVPVVLVPFDTLTTMEKINEIIGKVRFHEIVKIDKMMEVVKNQVDIDLLINF
ncbi:MAG: phosphotransacetylase family protein [Actinobacteria bacterium]|nr:phosphotransacetylase family protein [Actinomycetota bacterium]